MKLHFENIVTVLFFVVSLLILAPACSNVSQALEQHDTHQADDNSIIVNP